MKFDYFTYYITYYNKYNIVYTLYITTVIKMKLFLKYKHFKNTFLEFELIICSYYTMK